MYDGIAVALSLLLKEKENNPQAKPMLFVLTDGETGQGLSFKTIRPVIEGIRIPIYTIGYDANLPVLREVSSIVEAASINADQGDVEYKIGSLLNAQM
jgi:Ca-activated chloride channel family protein